MNYRLVTTLVAAGGLVIFSAFALLGQSKSNFSAPKHVFDKDHPSLEGIWQAKANAGDDVEKLLVGDKKLPYMGKAAEKAKENAKNKAKGDPLNHCWMPGIPRMIYMNYPFQIFQTAKYINLRFRVRSLVPASLHGWLETHRRLAGRILAGRFPR